uniref:IRS-type PTB domain-containing protein n=1 Tax=Timema monikensis TaxID=170555 RepID=A0A7R9HRG6_9NEOP|nr:unnamed protein product [Timema monikensis]
MLAKNRFRSLQKQKFERMGCISSKTDVNDLHPNIFQVMNVDDLGNRLNPGQLEITETDLVLYQRKKAPVKWPLRSLRRYGFDAELFSFESGRRCPTGPGIYAFRCQRAEQLFNLLQSHIQVRNSSSEDSGLRDTPTGAAPGPVVPTRPPAGVDTNYLEPSAVRPMVRGGVPGSIRISSQNSGSVRLSSVGSSSNGPISPQGTISPSPPPPSLPSAPAPPTAHYMNEEAVQPKMATAEPEQKAVVRHTRSFGDGVPGSVAPPVPVEAARNSIGGGECMATETLMVHPSSPSYINVDLSSGSSPRSPTVSQEDEGNYARLDLGETQQCPLYMNVIPGLENGTVTHTKHPPPLPLSLCYPDWELAEEPRHCYANLEPGEMELGLSRMAPLPPSFPLTPPALPPSHRQVNYIVLDLESSKTDTSPLVGTSTVTSHDAGSGPHPSASLCLPPESPRKAAAGYATIDFDKTAALLHSVNPSADNDSEGSRKTRHNSTINDILSPPARHSSSD